MSPYSLTEQIVPAWSEYIEWVPDVFACLWAELEENIQKVVGHAWGQQRPAEVNLFVELLLNAPDGRLPPLMKTYLNGAEPFDPKIRFTVPPKNRLQRAFVVAQSIDLAFETIRPKATPAGGLVKAGKGLGAFNRQQRQHGSYGRNPSTLGHVIPRGPLRLDRGKVGGNGDNLEQEFSHLTVVRPGALGSAYRLNVRVLPRRMRADAPDDTRVGFVPLAEQADDLHFQAITPSEGGAFLDVVPADETALAERALKALAELDAQGAHIAVFPELCVGPTTRRLIREGLRRKPAGSLSLILLGSGVSEEPAEEDRFYNECTALNGRGDLLWQQRKMNGYAMDCGRLTGCGIDHTATGMDHREWTWSGNVLEVVETEAGRRLMVLICEDLEQDTPSRAACRLTRPDWVFTPVLDASLRVGRWTHKRGWDLADKFIDRMVVANSAILHARARQTNAKLDADCGIGLCIDSTEPRRFHIATVPLSGPSPMNRVVAWTPGSWEETTVGVNPPSSPTA